MKKIICVALLLLCPTISFAGGKSHDSYSEPPCPTPAVPEKTHVAPIPAAPTPPVPVTPLQPMQPVITTAQLAPVPPIVNQSSVTVNQSSTNSGGGGGQLYCSSPTAPGWNVSLPNGGCVQSVPTLEVPSKVLRPVQVVRLSDMPYTGLTWWKYFLQLFSF